MIEIPGYRLLRPLGRGGMATVYLAVQESVEREVALKVMSPTLLGDAQFGERFLREARIAAMLRHRHVVQVHDVARHGDHHYIAMEYVPGGAVLARGDPPHAVGSALKAVREIAEALDYAHGKGVIHRDIKPDNILLREDGSAALTDFGIARASDITRMTRTGAIVGTPHYMSPEQARGQEVDGRADLYSLGIVFHELLVGRVPYEADDSLAVGIMHITAPLPRLPDALQAVQPLLDRLLAKDPEERFQRAGDLVEAIAQMEQRLAGGDTIAIPAVRATAATAVSPPPHAPVATRGRRDVGEADSYAEPTIGTFDGVVATATPRRRMVRRRRSGAGWLVFAVLLMAGAAAAWQSQDRLRALLPDTRLNSLLADASHALAEGRYSSPAGDGARELYAQVLAIDPDNQTARAGLRQVGDALLASARAALDAGDIARAQRELDLARELSVPMSQIEALGHELRTRAGQGEALDALLGNARAALEAGRLDGDGGALPLYLRAQSMAPASSVVRQELDAVLTRVLAEADRQRADGELDAATALVERVATVNPDHLGLPAARAALSDAAQARDVALGERLAAAERLLLQGRLTQPPGANARDAYAGILRDAPQDARARAGLERVAGALVAAARRRIADFEFDRAARLLDEAAELAPDSTDLASARRQLGESRERHARRFAAPAADPARDRQVTELLKQAAQAADAGRLMFPPGESAYDKYRAARTLDPDNPAANAGLAELPALARRHFETALGGTRLRDAHGYIETLQSLSPADAQLPDMRRRLARALIGYANERLGAGELARAAEALDHAGALDPTNAELPSLQARLEQARGG